MAAEDIRDVIQDTGTNEFEIVEFCIGDVHYGINVAKVREVINRPNITVIPQAHPYVDGLFNLRGNAIPLVNLPRCLNVQTSEDLKHVIVAEINNYDIAFLVDHVSRIHRISWQNMKITPEVGEQSRVVGTVKLNDMLILLLDFEMIVSEINPSISRDLTTITDTSENIKERRGKVHVLCAEDSPMLRELLVNTLHEAGYRYVRDFSNGQDAWFYLSRNLTKSPSPEDRVRVIISDIEMPQMGGHLLLKMVREDYRFNDVQFIVFSSIINEETRRRGENLGADGQIAKPQIDNLIAMMDKLVLGIDTHN